MAWTDEFVSKETGKADWTSAFVDSPKVEQQKPSPIEMFWTPENTQEVKKTLSEYGELVKNPMAIVEGAAEFASAIPAFGAGIVGAGQDLFQRIIAGDVDFEDYYNIASEGFQREYEKIPTYHPVSTGTDIVGKTAMAPMLALQQVGHQLADSDFVRSLPGDNQIRGLLKFGADLSGLYLQHGLMSPKAGPWLRNVDVKTITEARPGKPVASLDSLAKDLEANIADKFELRANDPRLKTPEGRQKIIDELASEFQAKGPSEIQIRQQAAQRQMANVPYGVSEISQVVRDPYAVDRQIAVKQSLSDLEAQKPSLDIRARRERQKQIEAEMPEEFEPFKPEVAITERTSQVVSGEKNLFQRNAAQQEAIAQQRNLQAELERAREQSLKQAPKWLREEEAKVETRGRVETESELPGLPKQEPTPVVTPVFNESLVVKSDGIESIVQKGIPEFDLYGKRKFNSVKEAAQALEETSVKAYREDLKQVGTDLQVIKVGNKYRLAEPLDLTAMEESAMRKYFEEKLQKESLTPEKAEAKLRDLGQQVAEWHQGNRAIDIDAVKEQIMEVGSNFIGEKTNPQTSFLVEAGDRMLSLINKEQARKVEPVETEPGVFKGQSARNPGHEILYNENGRPFVDDFEAANWLEHFGLEGYIEKAPQGSGWVIELSPGNKVNRSFKTFLDDIISLVKLDERGSFSLEKLPPEKIEAIRRLKEDARLAGKTIKAYAQELGYSQTIAEGFSKLVKDLSIERDLNRPSTATENFQTGEIVNSGKMSWTSRGETVQRPQVFQGELEALRAIKEPKRGIIGNITKEYLTTHQAIKGFDAPILKQFQRSYWEAEKRIVEMQKEHSTGLREAAKGLNKKARERIATNLYWRQPDIRARMERDGFVERDIPALTTREQQFVEYIDPILRDMGRRVNRARVENGQEPMKILDDGYFTVAYMETLAERLGFNPNITMDSLKMFNARKTALRETPFKFKKTRSKEGLKKRLKLDPVEIFDQYMRSAIRHEQLTPLIAKLHELREPLKTGRMIETAKGPKEELFTLGKEQPNLDRFIQRWANTLAGRDPHAFLALSDSPANRGIEKIASKLGNNLTASLLAGSLRTAEIQISALRNTAGKIGLGYSAKGVQLMAKTLMEGKIENILNRSRVLRSRVADVGLSDLVGGTAHRARQRAIQLGFEPLKRLDFGTALATWLGAESFALNKISKARKTGRFESLREHGIEFNSKLSDREMAARFADETVVETQGSGLAGDVSPVQRAALGKLIHLFQTFTISDWNFLYKDVFGIGNKNISTGLKAKRMMNYIVATVIFNSFFEDVVGINSPFPDPYRAMKKAKEEGKDGSEIVLDTVKELGEPIPVVGGALRYGFSPFGAVVQTTSELLNTIASQDRELRSSLLPKDMDEGIARRGALAAEALAKLAGTPGLGQAAKSIRAAKRGESPYGIVQGTYTPKKKKAKRF